MNTRPALLSAVLLLSSPVFAQAQKSPTPVPSSLTVRAVPVVTGLKNPWGIAFLPDGRMLITEREGQLRLATTDGKLSKPIAGVPEVAALGQGGLLDVALDPKFAENRWVYLSYAEKGLQSNTAVARAKLSADGAFLSELQVIYRQTPKVLSPAHFGSRLVFSEDGHLFITQGDRFSQREQAQNLQNTLGKVIRLMPDGSIPKDNPFVGRPGARPEIWSYGHRNVQAAALRPGTNELWTVEHGARGGDELNQPQKGKNYGWPVITYGVDYSGAKLGEGTAKAGMEQPAYYWDPVIAPSGMVFYTGDKYPGWKGSVFVGALREQVLVRLVIQDGKVTKEERHLPELRNRIRDVVQGPDGFLYIATDESNGRVLRVEPKG
ncbi:MAG: PQQ-dependent sugar dehydrogenase [Myxococcota bacterium]|nr:PQQ-dependent sugar dehydrogenase [Myxococcota bacterium]